MGKSNDTEKSQKISSLGTSFGFGSKIILSGNRELWVEGCKGILEYESNLIRLNLGTKQLKIGGRNLCVRTLEKNRVEIDGYILELTFG